MLPFFVEDFSIKFSPLYLLIKYLAIILEHPLHITLKKKMNGKNKFNHLHIATKIMENANCCKFDKTNYFDCFGCSSVKS